MDQTIDFTDKCAMFKFICALKMKNQHYNVDYSNTIVTFNIDNTCNVQQIYSVQLIE